MSDAKLKGVVYEYPGRNTKTFAMLPGYRNLIVLHTCEIWNLIPASTLESIIDLFSDARFLLDRLLSSLREKQAAKSWDSSYTVREPRADYATGNQSKADSELDDVESFHQSHPEFFAP